MKIDISKLDKAVVLACLFNCARAQGSGFLHYRPDHMTKTDAEKILAERGARLFFDYHDGRVMKVDLAGPEVETEAYDRVNGENRAWDALKHLFVGQ